MSFDEARFGFVVDAPDTTSTGFYLLVGDNAYGYSTAWTNLSAGVYGDIDTYSMNLDIGSSYTIGAANLGLTTPSVTDVDFAILNRYGQILGFSTDYGVYSSVSFIASDSRYFIQVFTGSVGHYGIRLSNNSVTEINGIGETISAGTIITAALDYGSDVDLYYFAGVAGQTYQIDIVSSIPDLFLDLEFGELAVGNIVSPYAGTYRFTAQYSGPYCLHISSNSFYSKGAYTFVTSLVDVISPTIAISSSRSNLTVGQTATITFALSEASTNFTADDVVVSGGTLSNFTGSGTLYTATFTPTENSTASAVISVASGSFSDAAGNTNADGSDANNRVTLSVNTVVIDKTAPTLQSISPSGGATGVAVDSNFIFSFDETVKAGTGNIVVKNGATTVANISVTDTSQVSFSGLVVTINPTNNLEQGIKYSVTVASGVIKDSAGNSWGGTASTTYEFTTIDTTAPTVSTFAPADGATGVAAGANIVLTFSEAIQRGTGKIEIRSGSTTGTLVESFEAATSNLLTFGTDKKLTINPTNDLAANTQYFVIFEAGTVKDLVGNSYAGTTGYDFVTALPTPTAGNDNLSGTSGNDSINALEGNDTIDGGEGNDTLIGGLGVDIFNITAGTDRVMDLGAGGVDVLSVSSGATVNATVTAAWTATAATANSGTANLTSAGIAVNFSAVTSGSSGFSVANTGKAVSFTGSGLADSLTGFAGNDTLIGGGGMDTLTGGAGNDVMTGGAAADRFVLQGGDTVVDFKSTDSDTVVITGLAIGAIVNFSNVTGSLDLSGSTTTAAFRATAAASGASIVGGSGADSLVGGIGADSLGGGLGNDTTTAGAGIDTVTGGRGTDSLTGGTGSDTFVFAAGDTGQATGSDTVSDFAKGAVNTGDRIDFGVDLVIGGSSSAATINEAFINQVNGVATFAAKSGATLADALADIATRFTAAGDAAGEFALFRVGGKGNHYLFISDGVAGVTTNDVVVQLVAVTAISTLDLTGGNLTIIA